MSAEFPMLRLQRLRHTPKLRAFVRNTKISVDKLVLPLFIRHGKGIKNAISSMPGHFQLSLDQLATEMEEIRQLGIKSVILFGIPAEKDSRGQSAYVDDGIIQSAIALIKQIAPDLLVMSDVCLCEYTDHGHCGVLLGENDSASLRIDNDNSLNLLAKQAVSHAQAGADVIAPSACMDGMVEAIRTALDAAGFQQIPILSYAVKYASSLYGPFRQAAEGAPQFGDRQSYQMDYANTHEAIRECNLDVNEGADMLMVKPAHTYLDIILRVKSTYPEIPLGAYHTSGEFAMIKSAAEKGLVSEKKCVIEILTAIHRAGADFILTYYAKEVAYWLQRQEV